MFLWDELSSHRLGRAEDGRDPAEVSCAECEDPGSDGSAVEVIQAPLRPSVRLNFLAAGTRGQYRLGYGQGVPGKESWQGRGRCLR